MIISLLIVLTMGRVGKTKRKGFDGKRPAEISRESANVSDLTQASSYVSSDQREVTRPLATTPESGMSSTLKEIRNVSAEKLRHSLFAKHDNDAHLTRSKSRYLGLTKLTKEEPAHGLKIQDFSLLNQTLYDGAVCKACCLKRSKLQLFQKMTKEQDSQNL